MELNKYVSQSGASGCLLPIFETNMDPGPFAGVACREFSIMRNMVWMSNRFYVSVSAWPQFGGWFMFE